MKQRQLFCRIGLYAVGVIFLTFGVMLCTVGALGISAITTLPYGISNAFHLDFPRTVFVANLIMFTIQMVIRLKLKIQQFRDLLQLPFSVVFSLLLDYFESLLQFQVEPLWARVLLVFISVCFMGVGTSLTINMNYAPVPSDGMTHAFSIASGLKLGTTKNIVDAVCVLSAIVIDLAVLGKITCVGIGTVICMIFMGRVIAVFEHFCREKILAITGLTGKVPERRSRSKTTS